MLLVLDNYDSFTFNLVQYLGELAADHPITETLRVERNDALSLADIRALQPDAILISPGPGDPDQSGVCLDVLRELSPAIPTLGVCLGHQSIAQVYGGKVVRAKELMHGKTSPVLHAGEGVFAGLPNPLTATRYHSLIAERESLPACWCSLSSLSSSAARPRQASAQTQPQRPRWRRLTRVRCRWKLSARSGLRATPYSAA